ncbi:MAG: glycosyl hydrolase family 28-related protein [Bacteroidetes bacterium]|nr:glycosyl hydrolase family 28-related protein [Bacteroidota bacterium]
MIKLFLVFLLIVPIAGIAQIKSAAKPLESNVAAKLHTDRDSTGMNSPQLTESDSGSVGIGTSNPSQNSKLEIKSTNKGLLLPRIGLTNTAQPNPLQSHEAGILLYNNNSISGLKPGFYGNDGEKWKRLAEEAATIFFNVKDFGAKGDNITNDAVSIQKAIDSAKSVGGGIVFFPAGNYIIDTTLYIKNAAGIILMGVGPFAGSTIKYRKSSGDFLKVQGSQHCSIKQIGFASADNIVSSSGNAIVLEQDCYVIELQDLRLNYCYNGIWIKKATEARLIKIHMLYLLGDYGVQFGGGGVNSNCYRAVISDIICNNPYLLDYPDINLNSNPSGLGDWVASRNYSTRDIVLSNGNIYQCVAAGTSGGGGPSGNGNGFINPQAINDGTVQWRFISKKLIWILYESNAYSLVLEKAALINGYTGVSMQNTVNPSAPPLWLFGVDIECDHSYQSQVDFLGGEGAYITTSWLGSCMNGNAINIVPPFKGQVSLTNSRVSFAGKHGILIGAFGNPSLPADILIQGNFIGGTSQNSYNTYHGIVMVGKESIISGNIIGNDVSSLANSQNTGVYILPGSSKIMVTNNRFRGNIANSVVNAIGSEALISTNFE